MKIAAEFNTIPISVIRFVIQNNLIRAFSIFLYLKNRCDGVMSANELSYSEMGESVGIKDKRTIQKYMNKLLSINWIGYNRKSKNYFIRGFRNVMQAKGLTSRHGVRIETRRP